MDSIGPRDRLQRGKRLEAGMPRNLVARHDASLAGAFSACLHDGSFHRHELRVEPPLGNRARGAKLRFEAEAIRVIPRDAVLSGDSFRAFELTGELEVFAVLARDRFAHAG